MKIIIHIVINIFNRFFNMHYCLLYQRFLQFFNFFVKPKTNINNKTETINCLHNSTLLERVVYSAADNDMVNELNSHHI